MTETANPLDLKVHDGTQYAPRHGVVDPAKRDRLAADMAANGWIGAPVVGDVETAQAITGSHRIPAAHAAGIEVPAVGLAELTAACGIDLWEFVATGGYVDLEDALPHLCAALPGNIVEAYGLDIE